MGAGRVVFSRVVASVVTPVMVGLLTSPVTELLSRAARARMLG